ncbi:MAG TPA: extracellular solute-binding protein [Clostridiales bacterium]|nr:extracellular solute-binding protein [Clostridiales bacterium]
MKRKFCNVLLVLVMVMSLFVGCSTADDESATEGNKDKAKTETNDEKATSEGSDIPDYINETGFPIVKEPITLTAMVLVSPSQPADWNEILAWQKYEEMTGIHIEWEAYTSAEILEKRNLALVSGEMPDLFFRTKLPDSDVSKYGVDGAFLELSSFIDQYAPNYKALTEKYDDVASGIPMADGNIYALPNLTESPSIEVTKKMFMNQKWLTATGNEFPITTEEFYNVLVDFRDKDPNGNGIADEIPLTADSLDDIILTLRGSFGLGNRGTGNGNWDVDPQSGELRFFPASNEYKEMLTYLNRLYSEKLLDQEIFTNDDGTAVLSKNEQGLVGSFAFANVAGRASSNAEDFAGLKEALLGPNGDKIFSSARGHIGSRGAFLISNTCKYPEAAMRWVDYFYSEEGSKLLFLGVEGESYGQKEDGSYDFLPEIVNNIPAGSSFDQVVSKYVPYAGGALPTIIYEDFFKGGETQPIPKEASQNMAPYLPKDLWAPFSFTTEESDRMIALETDIASLVKQRTAEFVQGMVSIDEFDKYVEQLYNMGLEDYKEIYGGAYKRYQE